MSLSTDTQTCSFHGRLNHRCSNVSRVGTPLSKKGGRPETSPTRQNTADTRKHRRRAESPPHASGIFGCSPAYHAFKQCFICKTKRFRNTDGGSVPPGRGGSRKKSHNTKKTIHSACSTLDNAWGQLTKLKLFLQTEHYLFTFINQSVHNDHSTKPAGRDAQEQLIDSLSVPAVDSSPDRLRTASSNDHEKQRDPKLRDTHTILIL